MSFMQMTKASMHFPQREKINKTVLFGGDFFVVGALRSVLSLRPSSAVPLGWLGEAIHALSASSCGSVFWQRQGRRVIRERLLFSDRIH